MNSTVDATVVVRTIGRPEMLRRCLESLTACQPRAAEIVVVDQSRGGDTAAVVDAFEPAGARRVISAERGRSIAANLGLASAAHDLVFFTDDDCTVRKDWIERGAGYLAQDRALCVTGRILADGDPFNVPVTRTALRPRNWRGRPISANLYACNFACFRDSALAIGGFDEALRTMEDWDLGYRWVKSGRPMAYVPDLVVWHHDWRDAEEMDLVWRDYAEGVAAFYRKLVRVRDPAAGYFLARDIRDALRSLVGPARRPHTRLHNPRTVFVAALLRELVRPSRP